MNVQILSLIDNSTHPSTQSSQFYTTATDGFLFEEEILIQDDKVIWCQFGNIRKTFSFHDAPRQRVIQAFWSYFILDDMSLAVSNYESHSHSNFNNTSAPAPSFGQPSMHLQDDGIDPSRAMKAMWNEIYTTKRISSNSDESMSLSELLPQRALTIFLIDSIKLFFDNGLSYSIPLPFSLKKAWPLDLGILIQCEHSEEGISTLFSLRHPLEELKVVSEMENYPSLCKAMWEVPEDVRPFQNIHDEVLYVYNGSSQGSLIFTYNHSTKLHEGWCCLVRDGESTRRSTPFSHTPTFSRKGSVSSELFERPSSYPSLDGISSCTSMSDKNQMKSTLFVKCFWKEHLR